jgi:hypothetical protein
VHTELSVLPAAEPLRGLRLPSGAVMPSVPLALGRADIRVAAAPVPMRAFELVNSGMLTTLLTHGLALTIVVLWSLPARASQDADREAF